MQMRTFFSSVTPVLLVLTTTSLGAQTGLSSATTGKGNGKVVEIYADGAIRGIALGQAKDGPVGTGSLGIRVIWPSKVITAIVNVASTADTLEGNSAGSFILNPAAGKALRSGIIDNHFHVKPVEKLLGSSAGLHVYSAAAQATLKGGTEVAEAVVLGVGGLVYKDLANGHVGDSANKARLKLEAGPSIRVLGGNVATGARKTFREAALGSSSRTYGGIEAGMQVQFGIVTASFQLYFYDDFTKNTHVEGVTGGQLIAGFSIGGPVFRGRLDEP